MLVSREVWHGVTTQGNEQHDLKDQGKQKVFFSPAFDKYFE
jgi:hypothetical protein